MTKKEKREAWDLLQEAYRRLGFKIPFLKFEAFCMGYHHFKETVAVFGFGRFDRKRQHIYGQQGVMIQVALQLNKLIFVYNEDTEQWYFGEITYFQGKKWCC